MSKWEFPPARFTPPLPQYVKDAIPFKRIMRPSEWAQEKMILGTGYGEQGPVSFAGREWQVEIVDAYMTYKKIIVCGPVQVGKTLAGLEIPWAWWQDNVGGHSLIVYEKEQKVRDVFEERTRHTVKDTLRHLWSGVDDDLRQDKIVLTNGIARCGSANVELGTFAADLVQLDEIAKYRSGFDIVGNAEGRMKSYKGLPGYHAIMGIVSSPKRVDDYLYKQVSSPATLILRYKMPCPRCSFYHELTDANIKEIPNEDKEFDHDPVRIRLDGAAKYECPRCGQDILDGERFNMIARGVWATDNEEISPAGTIVSRDKMRDRTDTVCFWFNRLVSTPDRWRWSDCLSTFFAARNSSDPQVWEMYQNEDMARFIDPHTKTITAPMLMLKCQEYYQYGERAMLPDDVVVMTAGIDVQDSGFWYSVVGWGQGMESWRVLHNFFRSDTNNPESKDYAMVSNNFIAELFGRNYMRKDGVSVDLLLAFMDEGGHRRDLVHFIARREARIRPYKGSSSKNAEPIRASKNDIHVMGNTQYWSELVNNQMAGDRWHLPRDVSKEYLSQVVQQTWKEKLDKRGNKKYEWVSGKDDHLRDAENLALAAAYYLRLPERLGNSESIMRTKIELARIADANRKRLKMTEHSKAVSDPFAYRDARWR